MQTQQKRFLIDVLFDFLSAEGEDLAKRSLAKEVIRELTEDLLEHEHDLAEVSHEDNTLLQERHDEELDSFSLLQLCRLNVRQANGNKHTLEFFGDEESEGLLVEQDGIPLGEVTHVERGSKMLSLKADGVWLDFDVSKFPKPWTQTLQVGKVYLLTGGC